MLNRRTTVGVIAGCFAVLVALLAYGVFGLDFPAVNGLGQSSQTSRATPTSPLVRSWYFLSINRDTALNLRLAPMHSLDKAAIRHQRAEKAKAARTAENKTLQSPQLTSPASVPPIQPPLDLSLPSLGVPIIADVPQPSHTPANVARDTPARTPRDQSKLDLDAGVNTPEYDSDQANKLFNRDNGLRGFMKQSWVNQTLGFQGGLAIKPERLRENDSDLRDNMAVGMGVLLAF